MIADAGWLPRLAALLLLALGGAGRAADADEPPVVGQPDHFNGAVGRFRVAVAADPIKVQAEDPLTYSVHITATSQVKQPPQRPALAEFPGFSDAFYIEEIGPAEGTRPDPQTWEFTYRLKPKNTAVRSIPSFPFVFFRPGFIPPRAGYMTAYAPAVALTVTPRKPVEPAKAITAPEEAFVLAGGDMLRQDSGDRLPPTLVLLVALLVPPVGCVGWLLVWRRLYPDAARLTQRRRSRAAQEALQALREIAPAPDREKQARGAAEAVAGYLSRRLELSISEPTPAEAEAHLRRRGISDQLAAETADFLRSCAAVRFDPEPPADADLAGAAEKVVLALEAEAWSA
jgi:hypothetical protein